MCKCAVLQLLQVIRWFCIRWLWIKTNRNFSYHLSDSCDKLSPCKQFWVFIWDALCWLIFFIPFVQKYQLIFHTFFCFFTSLNLFLDICLFSHVSYQIIEFRNQTLWTSAENCVQPNYTFCKNTSFWTGFLQAILTTKHHQWLQSATANYNDMKKIPSRVQPDQFKKSTQEGVKGTHQGLTSTLSTTVE